MLEIGNKLSLAEKALILYPDREAGNARRQYIQKNGGTEQDFVELKNGENDMSEMVQALVDAIPEVSKKMQETIDALPC